MVSRSSKKAGFFQRLGSPRSGRHLARFLKRVRRSRAMTAVIGGESAFLLLAHPTSRPSYFSPMSYWGGLSSPPSQPRTLDSTGSLDAVEVWTRPHFWHSNVRYSIPGGPASSFASSMRFRLHFGQRGRSIAEIAAEDTGWYSGMPRPSLSWKRYRTC
jgi:hypothetical protein